MIIFIVFSMLLDCLVLITKEFHMFLQIELQRTVHRPVYLRLGDWWPAALVGLVALLGGLPDANAGTLLGL